ncbi:MAG: carboxylating nicotinate-nucleotide diphosphorylase [Deltaproteobacteria bacterium]
MLLSKAVIRSMVRAALTEDAAAQDITTLDFIPLKVRVDAAVVAREKGVVCGIPFVLDVFRVFDPKARVTVLKKDGAQVRKGEAVLRIRGGGRTVLSCERVALNFLSYLSGIATQTHAAVRRVRACGIRILDTRKTTPLLRLAEKYAVAAGGGCNHRFNLSDQYLLKDNHIYIMRRTHACDFLRLRRPGVPFEIEVESMAELDNALALEPDIVMLDNFTPAQVRRALAHLRRMIPRKARRPLIELSGGIRVETLPRYAIRGVDFISLGSLTHSAVALDFSLEFTRCWLG